LWVGGRPVVTTRAWDELGQILETLRRIGRVEVVLGEDRSQAARVLADSDCASCQHDR